MKPRRNGFRVTEETGIERARSVVTQMVANGGCAWHREQTHASLTKYLVEETAEFIDSIDRELSTVEIAEELGDVLYQVLFHAEIASRDGEGYDFDSVASRLADKLVARHPHVFGERGYMSVDELNREWEHLKEDAAGAQRGTRGPLEGIPRAMPTLARAAKIVNRLRRHGSGLEQLLPVEENFFGAGNGNQPDSENLTEQQVGEALLAVISHADASGVNADHALRLALARVQSKIVEE